MITFICIALLSILFYSEANSQESLLPKRIYHTHRIAESIQIDGMLTESAWLSAERQSEFTQFEPQPFTTPKFKSEVMAVYTDEFIFVAAMLYDDPEKISTELTPRDGFLSSNSDYFAVSFDSYNDDLTGYRFIVSAAGIQADARIGRFENQNGTSYFDFNWDAVWESAIKKRNDGWTVEIKIPLFNIRFPKNPKQTWGLQFTRFVKRIGETSSWQAINPNVNGLVRQYGDMVGIENLKTPLRLSFNPYISLNYIRIPNQATTNVSKTFENQKGIAGGLDIKYGINENFTLDATLIPDFSQVQSDQKILNLTPFEQRFEERRPFFTEAVDLFNKCNIFYSRRIGGTPLNYWNVGNELKENETIISNPVQSQLYNASKISGRTGSKWGFGIFNAVSAPSFAKIKNSEDQSQRKIMTAALTNYNVSVAQKILPYNSSISLINANTMREGKSRDANVSGIEYIQKDKKNDYQLSLVGKLSQIFNHNQKDIVGYNTESSFRKLSGHFNWSIWNEIISKNWDPSDLGYFSGNNKMTTGIGINYNQTSAGKFFNSSNWWLNGGYINQFTPKQYSSWFSNIGFWAGLKNQGSINMWNYMQPFHSYDFNEPRTPGKKVRVLPYWNNGINFNSDSRKKLRLYAYIGSSLEPRKKYYNLSFALDPSYRFSDKFSVFYNLSYNPIQNERGYNTKSENNEIIFAERAQVTLSNTVYIVYNFHKTANFSVVARHYHSSVIINKFYRLEENGSLSATNYSAVRDFAVQYFNLDAVVQWQFKPGSFINLIWKNTADQYENIENKQAPNYGNQLEQLPSSGKANQLSLKLSYFLNGAKLFRKNTSG